MKTVIDLKVLKLYLPDGDRQSFYLHGDFRELFGVKFQSDAVKKIKAAIKDLELKPLPAVNYEESSAGIQSKRPETILKVLERIRSNAIAPNTISLTEKELGELHMKLTNWKTPKRQKWKVGDVFSITLRDNSFAFGQIIGKYPTVALFDFKNESADIAMKDLETKQVLTILHITPNNFNNWTYKIIGDHKLITHKDGGSLGSDKIRIGHRSFSSNVLESVCDYHWFNICKWTNPDDIKELILVN